jgi:hypothetical protein
MLLLKAEWPIPSSQNRHAEVTDRQRSCGTSAHRDHHALLSDSVSPFSIDIKDGKTVDHLKQAILKENPNTFANVEADPSTQTLEGQ